MIQLIIVMALVVMCHTVALPNLRNFIYTQSAQLSMQQIQYAINYARSLAVANGKSITICPSSGFECTNDWNQGILVIAPNNQKYSFKIYTSTFSSLTLAQSGFSGQKLVIEANGMTYSNGCFYYKSLNFSDFPQFKLYFNKALRLYMVNGRE